MTTNTAPIATRMQTTPVPYAAAAFTNGYEFTEGSGYQLPEYPFVTPPEIATGERKRHLIVIVGGGITGLTLARTPYYCDRLESHVVRFPHVNAPHAHDFYLDVA